MAAKATGVGNMDSARMEMAEAASMEFVMEWMVIQVVPMEMPETIDEDVRTVEAIVERFVVDRAGSIRLAPAG